MEGVTDPAFRFFIWLVGSPDTFRTPFARITEGQTYRSISPAFTFEQHPCRPSSFKTLPTVTPQLMAATPVDFVRIAEPLLRQSSLVELNAGCPSPRCLRGGAGSALLASVEHFGGFIGQICQRLGKSHLAIKMRIGYDDDQQFDDHLKTIAAEMPRMVTIHGRTKAQGYQGIASWDHVAMGCRHLPGSQVIGSGDIVDHLSCATRIAQTPGVSSVAVGRGALRNPWIFHELRQGYPVTLPSAIIPLSLEVYALLLQCLTNCQRQKPKAYPQKFARLIAHLIEEGPPQRSYDAWYQTVLTCRLAAADRPYSKSEDRPSADVKMPRSSVGVAVERGSLARTKMLYSYLRSSLPAELFDPSILRSPRLEDLLMHLRHRLSPYSKITLRYQGRYDWIYSGTKKPMNGS